MTEHLERERDQDISNAEWSSASNQPITDPPSPPCSDNEISSLYGKYRNSGHSSLTEFNPHPHSHSQHGEGVQSSSEPAMPHDPSTTSTQWPGVIDELNWMLGQAIDSAQSTFGHQNHIHQREPSLSHLSSYSQPSTESKHSNIYHLEHRSNSATLVQPSKEDLSELTTSSSHSDYSESLEDDRRQMMDQESIQETVTVQTSSGIAHNEAHTQAVIDPNSKQTNLESSPVLKRYPAHEVAAFTKYQADTLPQDCSMIALSTEESVESLQLDGTQTVYSEEDTASVSTNPSHVPLLRRSPSFKLNNFITRKYKDLVSSRKSEPIHHSTSPPTVGPTDPQTPTPLISAALPSQDSTPMNSPMMGGSNKPIVDIPARRVLEEEQSKTFKSPSPTAKSLMARSAVVKRSSSDINFLEQWQWLESQHPSSKKSLPNSSSKNISSASSNHSNLSSTPFTQSSNFASAIKPNLFNQQNLSSSNQPPIFAASHTQNFASSHQPTYASSNQPTFVSFNAQNSASSNAQNFASSNQQGFTSSSNNAVTNPAITPNSIHKHRETCLRILNDHFTCPDSAQEYFLKLALLSQRQQEHQQSRQRPSANKSTKTVKPGISSFQGVPTIDPKEFKRVKSTKDRCRVYETKLQQLRHHSTGLDLWVWLQTRGESRQMSSSPQVAKFSIAFQAVDSRPRPLPHTQVDYTGGPSINFHPSTELPPPPHDSSFPRDVSMSSIASFPLRDGAIPHKAVQIKHGTERNLVEMVRPQGVGHNTTNGMVVNSLMEVNNLPYPSLYPHSTNLHRGISPAPSSVELNSYTPSPTKQSPSKSILGNNHHSGLSKKSMLELSSKSTGGGFFSHLARQTSANAKRRNDIACNNNNQQQQQHTYDNSSPTRNNNNNFKISPALISAPISTPRGPRPDHGNFNNNNWQDTGDLAVSPLPQLPTQQQQTKLFTRSATLDMNPHQHEPEEAKRPSNSSSPSHQRMSFAYGSHRRQSMHRPSYHRYHNSASWTSFVGPDKNQQEDAQSVVEDGSRTRKPSLSDDLTRIDPSSNLNNKTCTGLDLAQQVELKSKLVKLLDILPNADQSLLEKILIESNLNDILAIGTYLELNQVKN